MGLTGVVQAASPEEKQQLLTTLGSDGFMRPFVEFSRFARYKFIVDIDGNSSAWNLVQKLKLGACVLKTGSRWKQWISDRLIPWQHYVPVAEDLSDLEEKSDWCFSNDGEAGQIAANGRALALSLDFAGEMREAARQFTQSDLTP